MMLLTCPWCGERPENEFHCGGTTAIIRPPLGCDDDAWGRYLFFRENPNTWVDGRDLAGIAGTYAWRSRIADIRPRFTALENRQRRFRAGTRQYVVSEYRAVLP